MSTCGGCTVELFLSDGAVGAYGEGRQFVTSAVADQAGVARLAAGSARGQVVTATSTLPTSQGRSTSEFSQGVLVP
jgi:hypothetical protein